MVKIPSRFIEAYDKDNVKEFYINIEQVQSIEVSKTIQPIWDSVNKKNTSELETIHYVAIQMNNGNFIPIKSFNSSQFQDFILWFDKNMGLEKLSKEL